MNTYFELDCTPLRCDLLVAIFTRYCQRPLWILIQSFKYPFVILQKTILFIKRVQMEFEPRLVKHWSDLLKKCISLSRFGLKIQSVMTIQYHKFAFLNVVWEILEIKVTMSIELVNWVCLHGAIWIYFDIDWIDAVVFGCTVQQVQVWNPYFFGRHYKRIDRVSFRIPYKIFISPFLENKNSINWCKFKFKFYIWFTISNRT